MDLYQYNQYVIAQKQELQDKEKISALKERLLFFSTATSLEEAKKLAVEIFPTNSEYTSFYVGNAKCSIINKSNLFRICVDTVDEFICYDFS